MERIATAHWEGNLKEGQGTVSTESGALKENKYSYNTRFVDGEKGMNPEELLGAAHASCFTMALAGNLTEKGFIPKSLDTKASVTLKGLTITNIHLSIKGNVPGISPDEFSNVIEDAKKNCPVSKTLKVQITSEAELVTKSALSV